MLRHLLELRRRILYVLFAFGAFFLVFFFYANALFHALVSPLLVIIPHKDSLIATQVTSLVLTPITLAIDAAMLSTAPFALFQLWRFVVPGLYPYERSKLLYIIAASLLLFCLGGLFCFYLVLPYMFHFFVKAAPVGVRFMPDIDYTVDFITRMLLLFGFCFQVPLLCLILVRVGCINVLLLKTLRPYVIVSAFTIGMLLTPPDVVSQIMLAVPLCLLYEIGIVLSRLSGNMGDKLLQ